ncbi:MAG: arginine--tRNA ligase [Chloroflexi bacterium]|nr:arginine--tRNA ligase [Chloroflexota bacterium]|tara:strand:+ start:725 stop:2392 length:1668 start_codon:yes stop_codon:yes gene_type:complete
MDISFALKKHLYKALSSVKQEYLKKSYKIDFVVEKPQIKEHGDYSSNIALQVSRGLNKNPEEIAKIIIKNLELPDFIKNVSFKKPGFINFFLSDQWLQENLKSILNKENNYSKKENFNKKIQVEFVSVNPTGNLHIGHARGAVIGSTLSNLLETQGFQVNREYYINDAGNQIDLFTESLYVRYMNLFNNNLPIPENGYEGKELEEIAEQIKSENYEKFTKISKKEALIHLKKIGIKQILNNIKNDLIELGVEYNSWFSEKSLIKSGEFKETINILKKKNLVFEKDGATWLDSKKLGDDKNNVLIKSDGGAPTYFATDIAYHKNKFLTRNFDTVIDIWGADHHGHIKRLSDALKALGIEKNRFVVILNQIVSLKTKSSMTKFSKRKGTSIPLKELIEEVGKDACRYNFLSKSPESQIEFDLDISKKKSNENPVFYVQYAHARMNSIIEKSKNFNFSKSTSNLKLLTHDSEIEIMKKLSEFPEILRFSSEKLEVHRLPQYTLELSQLLQKFYEECRVLPEKQEDYETSKSRLDLIKASKLILSETLSIMGMESPNKM